jgi:hypothetical protein
MCSYHYVTAGEGFDDFDKWCKGDTEYQGNPEFEYRWKSLGVHEKGDIDEHVLYEAVRAAGRYDLVAAATGVAPNLDELGVKPTSELTLTATPFKRRDPKTIPPRPWLYGLHYIRGFSVGDISPGGGSKTSNVLVEFISMATGIDLLECGHMYPTPLRVWYWNFEDPREEVERRIAAIVLHYRDRLDDAALMRLEENLFIDIGRERPIKLAIEVEHGTMIMHPPVVKALIREVKRCEVAVLAIDPFISSHAISENDNVKIDRVLKEGWNVIAEHGNCCVELIHHTRKIGKGEEYSSADARGASALMDGTRDARVYNSMTENEAAKMKIKPASERWRFFRVESDRNRMAPRGAVQPWRYLESVSLGNARDGFPPDGVGVVTAWKPEAADPLTTEIERDNIWKAALDLFNEGKRITKTHGNNSIKKMVPTFRKLTGMDNIDHRDISAAYEAAVNATPATWRYHDSNKAQHVAAGYVPVTA